MHKIKDFIKEHTLLIIAILILMIMLKGCSTDRLSRRYEFAANQYELKIDSLQAAIDNYKTEIKNYKDTIYIVRNENTTLKEVVSDVKRDKEFYKRVNMDLVSVIGNEQTK
jgi:predicted RND superfamily exporter protein